MGTLDRGGVESLVLRYAKIKKIIVHSHNTKDWRKNEHITVIMWTSPL